MDSDNLAISAISLEDAINGLNFKADDLRLLGNDLKRVEYGRGSKIIYTIGGGGVIASQRFSSAGLSLIVYPKGFGEFGVSFENKGGVRGDSVNLFFRNIHSAFLRAYEVRRNLKEQARVNAEKMRGEKQKLKGKKDEVIQDGFWYGLFSNVFNG